MGNGHCCSSQLNLFETIDRGKEILKFFQISSENEIVARYPCLGETLAHNIILKRRKFPLKRLRDVWNLETIREELLSECGFVVDDNIRAEPEITEFPNRPTTSYLSYAPDALPPLLPSMTPANPCNRFIGQVPSRLPAVTPSAPPPLPQLPPADHDVMELFEVLNRIGLVDRWREYLNNDQLLNVGDSLHSTTYRLATWNLDRLTVVKAKHPGIREAICLTILVHQFDLIAFQEVVEPEAVQMLVEELNSPKLPMIKRWMSVNKVKRGSFMGFSSSEKTGRTFQVAEYSSFLYRHDRISAISSRILEIADDNGRLFARLPFMSKFKIGSSTLILTSVHLKAAALHESESTKNAEEINCLTDFIDAMNDTFANHAYYAILGDFNLDPGNEAFDEFRSRGLVSALPAACATMASAVEKGAGIGKKAGASSRSTSSFDNAWLCPNLVAPQSKSRSKSASLVNDNDEDGDNTAATSAALHFTGLSAVSNPFRHPLIPAADFSDESGRPSDHCPVYFDLELLDRDN